MSLPVLYSFRRCPYAMRARLALACAGIRCELREVVLRDKPIEMLAISAKGTVPVLQLPPDSGNPGAGQVIAESIDIMHWALQQRDPAHWLALTAQEADASAALISRNDGEFKWALDRYKYADRYPQHSAEEYRSMADPFLRTLEARLQQGTGLVADRCTLADAAIFPFVRQFSMVDPAWFNASEYRALRQWLNDWLASSLFASVMTKYPQWQATDPVTVFAPQA
ncbi:glutathione S-transferase [Marinobacterium rhizophilum]|uniref:glutathione S-transferase n=1 Tax=Marinobacterium rhizophilum TaxID=420402 RepID=UPI0021055CE1|nr:glutathione S-transferase [Marinobacterium rhizophilum]